MICKVLPEPEKRNNCFSTEVFIYNLYLEDSKKLNDDSFKILDKLCKKIDVVKKVYIFYSVDLSYALANKEVKSEYSIVLLELLLHYAVSMKDYKFLNSSLKLYDMIQQDLDENIKDIFTKRSNTLLNKLNIII